jgi:hypothetical protein
MISDRGEKGSTIREEGDEVVGRGRDDPNLCIGFN